MNINLLPPPLRRQIKEKDALIVSEYLSSINEAREQLKINEVYEDTIAQIKENEKLALWITGMHKDLSGYCENELRYSDTLDMPLTCLLNEILACSYDFSEGKYDGIEHLVSPFIHREQYHYQWLTEMDRLIKAELKNGIYTDTDVFFYYWGSIDKLGISISKYVELRNNKSLKQYFVHLSEVDFMEWYSASKKLFNANGSPVDILADEIKDIITKQKNKGEIPNSEIKNICRRFDINPAFASTLKTWISNTVI